MTWESKGQISLSGVRRADQYKVRILAATAAAIFAVSCTSSAKLNDSKPANAEPAPSPPKPDDENNDDTVPSPPEALAACLSNNHAFKLRDLESDRPESG